MTQAQSLKSPYGCISGIENYLYVRYVAPYAYQNNASYFTPCQSKFRLKLPSIRFVTQHSGTSVERVLVPKNS